MDLLWADNDGSIDDKDQDAMQFDKRQVVADSSPMSPGDVGSELSDRPTEDQKLGDYEQESGAMKEASVHS